MEVVASKRTQIAPGFCRGISPDLAYGTSAQNSRLSLRDIGMGVNGPQPRPGGPTLHSQNLMRGIKDQEEVASHQMIGLDHYCVSASDFFLNVARDRVQSIDSKPLQRLSRSPSVSLSKLFFPGSCLVVHATWSVKRET